MPGAGLVQGEQGPHYSGVTAQWAAPGAVQPPAAPCPVLSVQPELISKLVGGARCSFSGHAT